jgi:hypothetical protein
MKRKGFKSKQEELTETEGLQWREKLQLLKERESWRIREGGK